MAPKYIADLLKEVLAVRRINTFLQTDDVEHLDATEGSATIATSDEKALTITGDITWHHEARSEEQSNTSEETSVFTLRGLDISFQKGKINLIAGKAGAGKTLLLLALLGEVKLLRGRVSYAVSPVLDPDQMDDEMDWSTFGDGVAYVPQVAWLQSLNIRYFIEDCFIEGLHHWRELTQTQRERSVWTSHERDSVQVRPSGEYLPSFRDDFAIDEAGLRSYTRFTTA